jgi:hypothetical protein
MVGQYRLLEVLQAMSKHLVYHWELAYLTPGGQSPQIWARRINTFWKPILWFHLGREVDDWHGDVVKSEVNDNDKRFHEWGQSESGLSDLFEKFVKPGSTVLDPFLSGGTIGAIALRRHCIFIGADKDQSAILTARRRLVLNAVS